MGLFKKNSKENMKNLYFELCLFKHLYTTYKLAEQEKVLFDNHILPLLDLNSPASRISLYFRLMNNIDYYKLSFWDRRYIRKTFNRSSLEDFMESSKTNKLFNRVLENIRNAPNGYLSYQYDGSVSHIETDFTNPYVFSQRDRIAPGNYITFAIYYTQFGDNHENSDEFRNYNIVAECGNTLQNQNNIAIISFSEVDYYKSLSVKL